MNPPDQNPTYIKIDDNSAYFATTSSTVLNVTSLVTEYNLLVNRATELKQTIQALSDNGCAGATTALKSL